VVIPAGCPQRIRCVGEQVLVFLALCTPRFVPGCYEDLEPVAG
ncbi:MAG TPA: cupin domain-containing protein, partial [Pseudomonas sp.]|nr:cupin domain-containing protein [Pseudomonas sp.]